MAQQRFRLFYLSPRDGADILDGNAVIASVPYTGNPTTVEERGQIIIDALNATEAVARFNRGDDDRCPTCGNRVDPDGFPLLFE